MIFAAANQESTYEMERLHMTNKAEHVGSEVAFFDAAQRQVISNLIARDLSGFEEACRSRTGMSWLHARIESADVDSFPGVHKYVVMAVGATLRHITDSDHRVSALYADLDMARQAAANALRIAAGR